MTARPIAAYSFLPWARQGLGLNAREGDFDTTVPLRATLDIGLKVTGEAKGGGTSELTVPTPSVQLYGPGDVVGIDLKVIVRTEPRHWITNFETNFLPFVEFYPEDLPWRYTPARPTPDGRRLRPWLALVVLEESEFEEGTNIMGRPLPFIEVADATQKFPPAEQLWAWAHVHVNGALTSAANDTAALAAELGQTVRDNRDLAYSRLLCPRILRENTAYHAFLVPTFEAGRLAGLGRDPARAKFATQSAWEEYAGREEATLYPVYYRWYFRTSTAGDFEFLMRLLQPREVDPRVGRRDMDTQRPGANLPGITHLGGVLRLGGALRVPLINLKGTDLEEFTAHEEWGEPYPHAFQSKLAELVNLADDYTQRSAAEAHAAIGLVAETDGEGDEEADEDPLIVPPIYGRWHSQTARLVPEDADPAKRRWVHELNHDPRHRVGAGLGTEVIKQNQEEYMEAAWQQVGKVLEANRKIRFAVMAKLTSQVWHTRELAVMREAATERFLSVATPVQRRLLVGGFTAFHKIKQSTLPPAVLSKTTRQLLRPRTRVSRLTGFDGRHGPRNLLDRINRGEVSAAPPKRVAPALPTVEQVEAHLALPADQGALEREPRLRFLPLALAVLLVVVLLLVLAPGLSAAGIAAVIGVGLALVAAGAWLTRRLGRRLEDARARDALLRPGQRTPASVALFPASPDFRVGTPGRDPAPTFGGTDSREAARFKAALRNVYAADVAERALRVAARAPLDLTSLAGATLDGVQPARTVAARLLGSVAVPPRVRDLMVASPVGGASAPLEEVMTYPEIDVPMYEPLKEMSSELFLPNIQLIPNNSITLLEPNQKFIESYMVGLNHEFARELLWREFPTDQRGSYFRQFWDVRSFLAAAPAAPADLRERLRDIPELHDWKLDTGLGEHDHRQEVGDKEEEVVLVIRGELLKKYPTAVIYAHRADWERNPDGSIDKTRPRKLKELPDPQAPNLPRDIVKTPLYEAQVAPDIYFFGFDLSAESAKGGQSVNGEPDPGWFFVIKERPGEPRFGLDLPKAAAQSVLHTWNDLSWTDVVSAFTPGAYLRPGERAAALTDPGAAAEPGLRQQFDEDSRFAWRADTHAAELAYILYQTPVLMAVHAVEMLKKIG